jgi:hypothetical protein
MFDADFTCKAKHGEIASFSQRRPMAMFVCAD